MAAAGTALMETEPASVTWDGEEFSVTRVGARTDTRTHAGLMHVSPMSSVIFVILSSSYFAETESDELCASVKCHTSAK